MTSNLPQIKTIEILDKSGAVAATIDTDRPQWSFDQYIRNRHTVGWTWREQAAA